MSFLELREIRKKFDAQEIIAPFTLQVEEGEILVLLGPSGCGKSTLLRLIAGLEEPDSGALFLESRDITFEEPKNRQIAMVFQNYALYPHLTVFENLMYPLKMRKLSKQRRLEIIEEVAGILEIDTLFRQLPGTLSGGQRQRVAIGRALVRDPKIFLFDEPLSNLDLRLREKLRLEIARLHQKFGRTMIYVTHDQQEAMTLGQRIVVMRQGRIEQAGSPMELYKNPQTKFVAEFLGSPPMNFLEIQTDKNCRPLPPFENFAVSPSIEAKDKYFAGIRGENLRFHKAREENRPCYIKARCFMMERLGHLTHVHFEFQEFKWVLICDSDQSLPEPGEFYDLEFKEDFLLFFDHTGRRV